MYDKSGADVTGVVGPLEEGATLVLICEVRGAETKVDTSIVAKDDKSAKIVVVHDAASERYSVRMIPLKRPRRPAGARPAPPAHVANNKPPSYLPSLVEFIKLYRDYFAK
ncbi:hypothetical protein EVAR_37781_1 [Eumeta japonica]|uniref:Uncharacterized protein n=1 Tax=Eumeta variegata TaxID=151549 RepID=A0A4C1WMZ9_EUMVA|nr:hypothetical protein EVAR_37781_1 [Eumeta japonica]